MKKAVIFDWAGTTVDYGCFAPLIPFIKVFEEIGITPTDDEVRAPMGSLKWEHINTMLKMPRIQEAFVALKGRTPEKEDVDALYEKFVPAVFSTLEKYTSIKPYVLETIDSLRAKGILIGSTTGYTDEMMEVVLKAAKSQGYAPDAVFTPDSTGGLGRPYPYMLYRNMEALKIESVTDVLKVGDTISDICEGKNAGVFTIGVLEGSSQVGLSQKEFEALGETQRQKILAEAEKAYLKAGADAVIYDIRGVLNYI